MEIWRYLLKLGAQHLREDRLPDATHYFERAHRWAPDEPLVMLALGRDRLRHRRLQEAEPLLRVAHHKLPKNPIAAALLARLLGLHLDRLPEAQGVLERALARCRQVAPLQVVAGELRLQEGAFGEARREFQQALDDPRAQRPARLGLARSHNAEGIAQSELGHHESAAFSFRRAASLDPEWGGPWVNLGVVLVRMGRLEPALEAYSRALLLNPASHEAYYNLGIVLHQLDRLEQAAEAFELLLELDPDYPAARERLANVLGQLRQYDRAIALLLQELKHDDQRPECWASLGLAYMVTGADQQAERCLLCSLELDPCCLQGLRNLMLLYSARGRTEEAQDLARRARLLAPAQTEELLASATLFRPLDS